MGKFMNNKKTIGQINGCNVYEVDDFLELTDLEMQISKKDQHRLDLLSEKGKMIYLALPRFKKDVLDNEWALVNGVIGKGSEKLRNAIKRSVDDKMQHYKDALFKILYDREQGDEVLATTLIRFLGV